MGTLPLTRQRLSSAALFIILAWTAACITGTWYFIFDQGVFKNGLIALSVTFFFATVLWAVPFVALVFFYLHVTPLESQAPEA